MNHPHTSERKTNPGLPERAGAIRFLPGPRGQRKEVLLSIGSSHSNVPAARAAVRICDVCGVPFDAAPDERLCPTCTERKC